MLAYRVESNKAGAEYQEQVLADWQTSKPSDNKEGCLLSQNIQVMKKEDILAGVSFKLKDGSGHVFKYQLDTLVYLVKAVPGGVWYYASIEMMNDAYMVVFTTFFDRLVKRKLYYKDLIKA